MEKTPRYTASEKRLLLKLIANQKDIIEKKKTDAFTNRSKENAWKIITKSYNNYVKFKRTTKQLRQLYKNMKYAANVNSTSTSNLSEMLEILEMQILNDPNIKSGENTKSVPPMPRTSSYSSHQPHPSDQRYDGHNNTSGELPQNLSTRDNDLFFNSIIKTEVLDEDDIDDEMIAQALSQQNDNGFPTEDFGHFHSTPQQNPTCSSTTTHTHNLFPTPNPSLSSNQTINPNANNDDGSTTLDDDIDELEDDCDDDFQSPPSRILENALKTISKVYPNSSPAVVAASPSKESLIVIAIEERRKKIELLETQIKYWKTLTQKIEKCEKMCCCKIESLHNSNQNRIVE